MALMVYFCGGCAKCWPIAAGDACPTCEEVRPSVDAIALVERLASRGLDEDAERHAAEDSQQ